MNALTIPPCFDDEPEYADCDRCMRRFDIDELSECAASIAILPYLECRECEADCGACRDENAREWAAEHGRRV